MSHTVKWSLSPLELALGGGCLPAPLGLGTSLFSVSLAHKASSCHAGWSIVPALTASSCPLCFETLTSVSSPQIPGQSDFPLRIFPKSPLLSDSTTLIALLRWIFSPGCVATIPASSLQGCQGPRGNSIFLSRAKQSSFVFKIGTFLQIHSWDGWVSALMRAGILKKASPPTSPHPNVMQKEKRKEGGDGVPYRRRDLGHRHWNVWGDVGPNL